MELLIGIVILLFSAILHEFMHGFVAYKLGDPTAKHAGRLTLNPIPHIDPIMSILVPLLLVISGSPIVFAAAKPVPVNPLNLHDGRKDLALVALAGPLTNLALAGMGALLFRVFQDIPYLSTFLFYVVLYNIMLGILNLVPIPPLDGSKFFSLFLPERFAYQYMAIGQYGMFILFALLLFPVGGFSLGDVLNHLSYAALRLLGVV